MIRRSTATERVAQIHSLRKEALLSDTTCSVRDGPFDTFHNLKKDISQYPPLSNFDTIHVNIVLELMKKLHFLHLKHLFRYTWLASGTMHMSWMYFTHRYLHLRMLVVPALCLRPIHLKRKF